MFKILDGREYFYQWDLNQKLIVEDDSINEVHFSNRTDGCSLVVEVDELRQASVPNILLQDYWDIRVYAYCSSGESKYTKVEEKFEVKKRPKPSYYIYTEEENKIWDNKVDIFQGKENSKKILSTNENGKVVTEINVDEILTNKDIPRPTASDEGTYLGCENGAATWMPVGASGGGKEWRLINKFTIETEDLVKIYFDKDLDGNPFELSEVWLLGDGRNATTHSGSTNVSVYFRFGDGSVGADAAQYSYPIRFNSGFINYQCGLMSFVQIITDTTAIGFAGALGNATDTRFNNALTIGITNSNYSACGAIREIAIFPGNNTVLYGVGTIVSVWGR